MKNIKASIITPIHINNWEFYERLDYFIRESQLYIVEPTWIQKITDKKIFDWIISSLEAWKFKNLENYKSKLDLSEIKIIDSVKIKKQALETLNNFGDKNNQWQIKKFFADKFTNTPIIPGSTLKGIFRSVFLFANADNNYKNSFSKEQVQDLEKKANDYFKFIWFADTKIQNPNKSIQKILWVNKKTSTWKQEWVPQVVETVDTGDFDINIESSNWTNIDLWSDFEKTIKEYSNILITREEQILNNIWIQTDFIDKLYELYDQWKYPIKIGMFKKSLSYKMFWEELLSNEVYYFDKKKQKDIMDLDMARKVWVWDKSIYLDEDQNPMWWIVLEF